MNERMICSYPNRGKYSIHEQIYQEVEKVTHKNWLWTQTDWNDGILSVRTAALWSYIISLSRFHAAAWSHLKIHQSGQSLARKTSSFWCSISFNLFWPNSFVSNPASGFFLMHNTHLWWRMLSNLPTHTVKISPIFSSKMLRHASSQKSRKIRRTRSRQHRRPHGGELARIFMVWRQSNPNHE